MSHESTQLTLPPRTLRLDLEYDGTDFAGWQIQPGLRTVQGTLEAALGRILDQPGATIVGAGRTDSGTHAAGQVGHVRTASPIAVESLRAGMNSALPRDLRVRAVSEQPPTFHARYSATAKEYRYHFWHGGAVPPFLRSYCHGIHGRLDVAAMAEAALSLEGHHDMSSFRASHCTARSPERTIHASRVAAHGAMVVYAIRARGFLQHMVRIIAGTLLQVGRGRLVAADVARIRDLRNRSAAPPTAPAAGLFLVRVEYGKILDANPEPVLTFSDYRT